MSSFSLKAASKTLKFAALAVFCAFAVLLSDYYYQLKDYSAGLSSELSMTVFFNRLCEDDAQVCENIESLGFVSVDEYVSADEMYEIALEKNPFLKEISVPGDKDAYQAYAKVSPKELPTDEFLVVVRNAMAQVDNVDEVVFDTDRFREYVRAENTLGFLEKIVVFFAGAVFVLCIIQALFFIFEKPGNGKKLLINFIAYIIAASIGFVAVWSVCLFLQYPLLIDEKAAFAAIALTALLGIILKD